MKKGLNPIPRLDLNSINQHFETTWVEIENTKEKNILICCAYSHPNTDPDILIDYLQDVLSNDAIKNKKSLF